MRKYEVVGDPRVDQGDLVMLVQVGNGPESYHYYRKIASGTRQDMLAISERLNEVDA